MRRLKASLFGVPLFLISMFPFSYVCLAQQINTLKGRVVDRNNNGIPRIPVLVQRGAEIIATVTTDKDGFYSIELKSGATIEAVIYGNTEYLPNSVFSISGASDQNITKVLTKYSKGMMLSRSEASDALTTLDYFRQHPPLFAGQMMEYAGVIDENSVPQELRPRLREFERSVATLRKDTINQNRFAHVAIKNPEVKVNGKRVSIKSTAAINALWGGIIAAAGGQFTGVSTSRFFYQMSIKSEADLVVGSKVLLAGEYRLTARQTNEEAVLLFYQKRKGPDGSRSIEGVAELPLKVEDNSEAPQERVVSLISEEGKVVIKFHWGKLLFTGSFDVK